MKQPFGSNSAEAEREYFERLYVPVEWEDTLLAPRTHLILGDRGTGKTALAEYLRFQVKHRYAAYVYLDPLSLSPTLATQVLHHERRGGPMLVEDVAALWLTVLWTGLILRLFLDAGLRSRAVKRYLQNVGLLSSPLKNPARASTSSARTDCHPDSIDLFRSP